MLGFGKNEFTIRDLLRHTILCIYTIVFSQTALTSELELQNREAFKKDFLERTKQNIVNFRKSDVVIEILEQIGNVLKGWKVDIELTRHEILIGNTY